MQFSVIYTADVAKHRDPEHFAPYSWEVSCEVWQETEGDNQYDVPDKFAQDAKGEDFYKWKNGHHRKWCAVLDEEQFAEFIKDGSLTVSGEGAAIGGVTASFSRAVVFTGYDEEDVITEAFVTPHCEKNEVADWLRAHEHAVPACLADARGQRYLFRGIKDRRSIWQSVFDCMKEVFN